MRYQWVTTVIITLLLLVFLGFAYFYRDPERKITYNKDEVLSPADGMVVLIKENVKSDYLPGTFTEIGIFMDLSNVHIQRMPFPGKILSLVHKPGKYLPAYKAGAGKENNQNIFVVEGPVTAVVKQIAGILVQKCISWVKEGDELKAGDRFGMIRFSSRVDIFLPSNVNIVVKEGMKVNAGLTVIGIIKK
jgi:phosphatidylserine decarboxylase